ncbi:GNAT family N-acetyltransferase [Natronomonas salina]|uniref:GNAT family N-acetyltransferase n=1 Tax=Natronomonas salina TaxID=1710540 RepID=UPI0015B564C2|nr:GNAT family N-acetyltransferase [Natronomonas salina]QLD89677.1 GNAT family N-acetyltransferase [Natronomonas salina]
MNGVVVREATAEAEPTARSILNAAMLEVDDETVERSTVLVAVDDGRVLGALVLDDERIDAVAVRPGRRGQGVGSALVEAAASRREQVTASFDPGVRPFYESLGFEVDCGEDGSDEDGGDDDGGDGTERCRGTLR